MRKIELKLDSRNRICLTKLSDHLPSRFVAYEQKGRIILEPLVEIPASEAWIFEPQNRKLLEEVKKGLEQKGTIDRGSFKKHLK